VIKIALFLGDDEHGWSDDSIFNLKMVVMQK